MQTRREGACQKPLRVKLLLRCNLLTYFKNFLSNLRPPVHHFCIRRQRSARMMSRTMFAVVVVLLNTLSFTSLAYIANRKGYHAMAALAAAGAWLFGVTGGVLIWGIWR
jgi:hypothetical protein